VEQIASGSKETKVRVRIDPSGMWIQGERVTGVETGEDGDVYLLLRKDNDSESSMESL